MENDPHQQYDAEIPGAILRVAAPFGNKKGEHGECKTSDAPRPHHRRSNTGEKEHADVIDDHKKGGHDLQLIAAQKPRCRLVRFLYHVLIVTPSERKVHSLIFFGSKNIYSDFSPRPKQGSKSVRSPV